MVREKKIASEKSRVGGMKVNSSVNRLKKKNLLVKNLKASLFLEGNSQEVHRKKKPFLMSVRNSHIAKHFSH